jgi:acyl-CoA reductase-like NAD-dependent aldehyde dehydrogenase
VLSDIAIDLDAVIVDAAPGEEEWRRYVAGDRAVFARRIADAIDADTVDRIATAYRENQQFRDAANIYLDEFEALLEKTKENDSGGILTSTVLSADTGKTYLAIAYSLGRLSA